LIQVCADAATSGLTQVDNLNNLVEVKRGEHSGCRVTEASLRDELSTECVAWDLYRKNPSNAPPSCMQQSMTGTNFATDDLIKKRSMESCLEDIHLWFPGTWEIYIKCRDSSALLSNKTAECNSDQSDFESSFCQYSLLYSSVCTSQSDCRAVNIDARNKAHAAVKVAEAARSTDCEVGHKVKCLLGIFEEKNNTKKPEMLTVCKALEPSCPDGITYPDIPGATTCTPETYEPCDTEWLETEYESQTWFSKAPTGECVECLRPAETTTPAPAP